MKLLHASDLHLDSPFTGLTPEQAMTRRAELRRIPARLAELARRERVDLLLLPGDLFDGERVYPETIQSLTEALASLDIPVFIAPGNHDCYHSRSPYAVNRWPDHVHIFTAPELRAVELPRLNCVVHGCAFTSPYREDSPLTGFSAPDDGRLHLLCLHSEIAPAGRYAPIAPKELAASNIRYAALGHVHTASSGTEGHTLWAYSGCPEGRGFDESGPKGVLLVSFDEPAALVINSPDGPSAAFSAGSPPAAVSFLPLCQREYRIEAVDVSDFPSVLPQEPSPDLVRFLLRGERARPLDLAALTAQAAPHFFHVELRDETTLPQDLWARADEDSLTGLFLREMRRQLDAAPADQRETVILAARFGLAALEGGEDIRP